MALIATLLCIVGVGYLFWADGAESKSVSSAVLIPLIWFFFSASHYPSEWLGAPPPDLAAGEGSPLDRNVFLALIVAGVWILSRRSVDWRRAVGSNPAVWLFFLYCFISAGWADDPLLSLKRFIKGIGNLVMSLVILSEENPEEALAYCIRRMSFILLPLSVLYIKFFPSLGRSYFMGEPMYNGATYGKNALGQLCLICGIYFSWEVLVGRSRISADGKTVRLLVLTVMILMTIWLLHMANSATSIFCMILATSLLLLMRTKFVTKKPHRIFYIASAGILAFAALDALFGVKESIILMQRESPTLRIVILSGNSSFRCRKAPGSGTDTRVSGRASDLRTSGRGSASKGLSKPITGSSRST